jgi:hypothetical protein
MRVFAALLLWAALAGGCRPAPATTSPEPERSRIDAPAIIAEVDRLAGMELWPGFDPAAVPVAIYDGENTLLFRHPAPPTGFYESPEHPGVLRYAGRHPSVAANTSIELNGVRTATLMPGAEGASLRRRAGLLIHEAFHVFQREHHPGWSADEAELFAYPVADAELLALRPPVQRLHTGRRAVDLPEVSALRMRCQAKRGDQVVSAGLHAVRRGAGGGSSWKYPCAASILQLCREAAPFPAAGVGDLNHPPALQTAEELEGVDAAVAELVAQVESVLHPGRGQVLVDADLDVPDPFVPYLLVRRAHRLDESVHRLAA